MTDAFDPQEILRRIFEPLPADWLTRFAVGDRVRLVRSQPTGFVPVGAAGQVVAVEGEGVMAEKGRPYQVCFDVRPYAIRARDIFTAETLRSPGVDPDEILQSTTTNLGPYDIEHLHPAGNQRSDRGLLVTG